MVMGYQVTILCFDEHPNAPKDFLEAVKCPDSSSQNLAKTKMV